MPSTNGIAMRSVSRLCCTLLAAGWLTACSSVSQSPGTMQPVVLAEPLQVDYESEVALARLGQMLGEPSLTAEEHAGLLYERGMLFDRVGLRALARYDLTRALSLKPDFADAYNLLGLYYTQAQEFDEAYQSFDSVLELSPQNEFGLLNRGIALYYGSRYDLAVQDLEKVVAMSPQDGYRALWYYFALYEQDPEMAQNKLRDLRDRHATPEWVWELPALMLGETTEAEFIQSLPEGLSNNRELAERLCEAYFYLAKHKLHQGQPDLARNYFKLALASNVQEYIEHGFSLLELDQLDAAL